MKQIQTTAFLIFILFATAIPGFCQTSPDTQESFNGGLDTHYQQAKFFYNQLKTNASLGSSRENWLKGSGNFRRIYLAEPKSELAPACLFMLGKIYYDMYKAFGKGIDLGESISYYRDVGSLFPQHTMADDAYYFAGIILLEEVKDPKRAARSFAKIVSDYPGGDMHALAETKLKVLSKDFDIPLPTVMIGSSQLTKLTNVLPVKYWSSNDYTRVVIKTSGPVTYHEELLEEIGNQPRRLYIDFQESYIEPRFRSPVPIEDGLLKRIRTGQYTPDTVRVVLDIESISSYKIFSLPDPFRVVIDVRGATKSGASMHVANVSAAQPMPGYTMPKIPEIPRANRSNPALSLDHSPVDPAPPLNQEKRSAKTSLASASGTDHSSPDTADPPIVLRDKKKAPATGNTLSDRSFAAYHVASVTPRFSLAQQLGLGVRKVVIDPGHGGKDPGAIAFGLKEKDIVLKVARKLAVHMRDNLGVEVLLTRDNDIFLPLEERTAIANTSGADLFVSLHINAHPSSDVKGFETYFLNLSTNDEAMRVAARENATSTHQMSDLQDILSDIMKNSKINESSRLAQHVHSAIDSDLTTPPFKLKNMGVKQAPFYVLIGAEMPAILIELAFISNPDDANLLANEKFINKITGTIAAGIQQYVHATTAQLQ